MNQSEMHRRLGRLEIRLEQLKQGLDALNLQMARQAVAAMMDELTPLQIVMMEQQFETVPDATVRPEHMYIEPQPCKPMCGKCGKRSAAAVQPAGFGMPMCNNCIKAAEDCDGSNTEF